MEQYYRILGLEPGASKVEIKKAYFKLIRQYSPEKEPEKFQKIRNAYEQLNKEENAADGVGLPKPAEPFANKMLEQIYRYRDCGNNEGSRDTCEEAVKRFPNELIFRYLLVRAYRTCGNTGKAVKAAEKLVELQPENKDFQRELAFAYEDRGYVQKAYSAYENAFALGCRDIDFLIDFARNCEDYGEFQKAIDLLLLALHSERKWVKDNAPDLAEIIAGLLLFSEKSNNYRIGEVLTEVVGKVRQYSIYLKEYVVPLAMNLMFLHVSDADGSNALEAYANFWKVIKDLANVEQWEDIEMNKKITIASMVTGDPRLDEPIKLCVEVYMLLDTMENINYREKKFAMLDAKLCMIEERETLLPQLEIVKAEYPDAYESMGEIITLLQEEDKLEERKRLMMKDYLRLNNMVEDGPGGYYAERYPDKMHSPDVKVIADGSDGIPYVRSEAKIGRNDPCPCGSGKKYKQCCMKK